MQELQPVAPAPAPAAMQFVPRAKNAAIDNKKDGQALLHFALRMRLPSLVHEGRRQLEKNALKHAPRPKEAALAGKKGRQSLRHFAARFKLPSLINEGRRQLEKKVLKHAQWQSADRHQDVVGSASAVPVPMPVADAEVVQISRPPSLGFTWETEPLDGAPHLSGLRVETVDKYAGAQGAFTSYLTATGETTLGKFPGFEQDRRSIEWLLWEMEGFYRAAQFGKCDNVVSAYGIARVPRSWGTSYALMEDEVPGRSGLEMFAGLEQHLLNGDRAEFWAALQVMADDLLNGLEHLSLAGVVHDDLKAENIVVDRRTGSAVIVDLGSWGEQDTSSGPEGLHSDMAPERRRPPYLRTEKTDVYALGVLLRKAAAVAAIFVPAQEEGNAASRAQADFDELLSRLTHEDPAQRPTAAEARKLKFLIRRALPAEVGRQVLRETIEMLDAVRLRSEGQGAAAPMSGITGP
jgi:hypothetical protein